MPQLSEPVGVLGPVGGGARVRVAGRLGWGGRCLRRRRWRWARKVRERER